MYESTQLAGSRLVDEDDGDSVEFTTSKDIQIYPTFEAMGLKEDLLRGIYSYGAPL